MKNKLTKEEFKTLRNSRKFQREQLVKLNDNKTNNISRTRAK